jgi:hypothetical protein
MKKLFISCSVILALASCKKQKISDPNPITPRDPSTINQFLDANATVPQLYTLSTASVQQIVGAKGTTVTIPALAFKTKGGTTILGNVEIKLLEIYGKKEMIINKAQSATRDDIFTSAGQIKITAKQGDEDLVLSAVKTITVSYPTSVTPGNDFMAFYGKTDATTSNNYYVADSVGVDNNAAPVIAAVMNYELASDSLDWISCGRFSLSVSPKTTFSVTLIGNFNITNTEVFVVYTSAKSVAYLNKISEQAYSSTYRIPVGTNFTIVALSKINGRYFASYTSGTMTALYTKELSFTETNEAEILAKLATL